MAFCYICTYLNLWSTILIPTFVLFFCNDKSNLLSYHLGFIAIELIAFVRRFKCGYKALEKRQRIFLITHYSRRIFKLSFCFSTFVHSYKFFLLWTYRFSNIIEYFKIFFFWNILYVYNFTNKTTNRIFKTGKFLDI